MKHEFQLGLLCPESRLAQRSSVTLWWEDPAVSTGRESVWSRDPLHVSTAHRDGEAPAGTSRTLLFLLRSLGLGRGRILGFMFTWRILVF